MSTRSRSKSTALDMLDKQWPQDRTGDQLLSESKRWDRQSASERVAIPITEARFKELREFVTLLKGMLRWLSKEVLFRGVVPQSSH